MAATELRQVFYSTTGRGGNCSTDAPYYVKNTANGKCALECLDLVSCSDYNYRSDLRECALFLHKPLFYDYIPGCTGYKASLFSC